jgi:hypothetical protein
MIDAVAALLASYVLLLLLGRCGLTHTRDDDDARELSPIPRYDR